MWECPPLERDLPGRALIGFHPACSDLTSGKPAEHFLSRRPNNSRPYAGLEQRLFAHEDALKSVYDA
jgi:hypothetical protein